MINIKGKYLLILLLPFMSACSDWMELTPLDGLVRDEYWNTKEDVEAVLMGAYQLFAQQDEFLFMYGEIRGDMISPGEWLNDDRRAIMEGTINSDNSLSDWQDLYKVINYSNLVLENGPIVYGKDATYTEYLMKGHQSEALFLRSLAYFYLVRTFKEVPLVLYAVETDAVELSPEKSSEQVILAQLEEDLRLARLGVTDDYGSLVENKGRVTKAAINTLLADIALWNFDYEACVSYVEAVESSEYELTPTSSWFELFYPGNSSESIFEFQFDQSLEQVSSMYSYTFYGFQFMPSAEAIELLQPITIRGSGSIQYQNETIWKYIGKYNDSYSTRSSSDAQSVNWIVYRLSEVMLMKAEALSQLNRFDESLAIINELRTKRYMIMLESPEQTPEAFEDIILNERAIELAFEGKRWFDLLRMGRRNDFKRKSELIEILVENVSASQKLIKAAKLTNPLGWYLPIEEEELERNSNLIQNPYYATY